MTAATHLAQRGPDRAEQVEHLRRRIAAISGKVGTGHRGISQSDDVLPGVLPDPQSLLPVPEPSPESGGYTQAGQLPGPVPRGSVAVLSGARSLLLSMAAAVTAAGGHAAIVGQPDIGLLAAVEMGADLTRLAVIPDPGTDPVEVAAVLMDGMDLVALGLGGRSIPPTRARAVTARARQKGCTLLVTDGDWHGASARLEARVCGYDVTGDLAGGRGKPTPGRGRISRVRLAMRTRGRFAGRGRAVGE